MLTSKQVADYLLSRASLEDGDLISHLKLQKLVYYCQGFHLVMFDRPMFNAKIEAWEHGPVVRELWFQFNSLGSNSIPAPEHLNRADYSQDELELMDEVFEVYGQFSAWKLRNMTHAEPPWSVAYSQGKNTEITHESLKSYFSTLVE